MKLLWAKPRVSSLNRRWNGAHWHGQTEACGLHAYATKIPVQWVPYAGVTTLRQLPFVIEFPGVNGLLDPFDTRLKVRASHQL
jgi:hypothetical protein